MLRNKTDIKVLVEFTHEVYVDPLPARAPAPARHRFAPAPHCPPAPRSPRVPPMFLPRVHGSGRRGRDRGWRAGEGRSRFCRYLLCMYPGGSGPGEEGAGEGPGLGHGALLCARTRPPPQTWAQRRPLPLSAPQTWAQLSRQSCPWCSCLWFIP